MIGPYKIPRGTLGLFITTSMHAHFLKKVTQLKTFYGPQYFIKDYVFNYNHTNTPSFKLDLINNFCINSLQSIFKVQAQLSIDHNIL